jgi:hypothetical protein
VRPLHIDVDEKHWLGESYSNDGWRRLTLFHIKRNTFGGGSTSWPVADIDIVNHPSKDGCNPHSEIKISIRNDIRQSGNDIDVDGNKKKLRYPADIVGESTVNQVISKLKENLFVKEPLAVYVCMRHVEDFWVEGAFWSDN